MIRLTFKQLAAKKARLAATTIAVLLGVTFLTGTLVLTDSIDHTLDTILADANAGTDAFIRTPSPLDLGFGEDRPGLDSHLIEVVRSIDGVADVAGRITGYAQIVDADGAPVGNAEQAPALGLNWIDVGELNAYRISDGHAPNRDDEIVIDKRSARLGHLEVGDHTTVLTNGAPAQVTISGIATFGEADSPGNATAVLFTDAAAERLLGKPDEVDGIAVAATPGTSQDELVRSIREQLPAAEELEVVSGAELTREDQAAVATSLSFFYVFMWIFAAIAVFVGAFIINNIFSITVAQRTREMALLRAIGADRRQVLRNVLIEAALVGSIASALGLALGKVAASGLIALLESFGFDMPSGPTVLTMRTLMISLAVGMVVTVASSWLPARRAARIAPVAAMRSVAFERGDGSRTRTILGGAAAGAGVLGVLGGLAQGEPALVGLGAAVVFIGVAVLGPILVPPLARVLGAPAARFRGVPGRLARENAIRNPARTSRTAAALMIGVGLVGFVSIFAASLRSSIEGSFDDDFSGNLVIDSGSFDSTYGITTHLADTLRTEPAVTTLSPVRLAHTSINGSTEYLQAFDPSTIATLFDLGPVDGDLARLGDDGIAVFAGNATDHGWELGDSLAVTFASGTHDLVIRAIYSKSEAWIGQQFVGLDTFRRYVPDQLDSRIYLSTTDRGAVEQVALGYPSVETLDTQEFIDSHNQEVNALLGLVYALLALAILIALLGIGNALTLSILERTRELGLLRALGMSRPQLRSTIRWESILLSLFGTALGLGIGAFFGWALVNALRDEGITTLTIPWASLAVVAIVASLAGVGAGTMPARRAARLDVLGAISAN